PQASASCKEEHRRSEPKIEELTKRLHEQAGANKKETKAMDTEIEKLRSTIDTIKNVIAVSK
ncbi:hypothetical protein A4X13_0g9212, partial [Tilletia indica]